MVDLQMYKARVCNTTAGFLVLEGKVLLVKHKKLGIWLAPGGHVEEGELPHKAAEREFFEETGLTVKAKSQSYFLDSNESEYLPNPIATNLHWISKENYQSRLNGLPIPDNIKWPRGCEQHLCWIYLMDLSDSSSDVLTHDPHESDDIGWFTSTEIDNLQTVQNIKDEAKLCLTLGT